jgi:hypothetical protein
MTSRSWIRRLFDRKPPTIHKAPARRRPAVEVLEQRLAPASLTISTLADNTTDTSVLTLRDAITLVNSGGTPGALGQSSMPAAWAAQITGTFGSNDTITIPNTLYSNSINLLTGVPASTIQLNGTQLPTVMTPLTITGDVTPIGFQGVPVWYISGEHLSRVFQVGPTGNLTLNNLIIKNGIAVPNAVDAGAGGGILALGPLTLHNVTVSNSTAFARLGGGIFATGPLTLDNSTVSNNKAGAGGGIVALGPLTLDNGSTVSNNTAFLSAGGILAEGGQLSLDNATVSNNTALDGDGGAIYFTQAVPSSTSALTLTISNSSITNNTAEVTDAASATQGRGVGGGIFFRSLGPSTVTISNSSITNNTVRATNGGNGANGTNLTRAQGGGSGGNGADASGGGLFLDAAAGTVTLLSDTFSGNQALAGNGGNGGNGANGGAGNDLHPLGSNGGGGGNGGRGGSASGGGLYLSLAAGTLTLTNDAFTGNTALGGQGGQGGSGGSGGQGFGGAFPNSYGNNGGAGGFGGAGSAGGAGKGGGLYVAADTITLTNDVLSGNNATGGNSGQGGPGATGGNGGPGISHGRGGRGGHGGTGGASGNGGASAGGGLYVAAGNVTLTNDTLSANNASGGNGSTAGHGASGGNGAPGSTAGWGGDGGVGGNGGGGGAASGGGLSVAGGTATLTNDTLGLNNASGGIGGTGEYGAAGGISGGTGGFGGRGGVGGRGGDGGAGTGGGLSVAGDAATLTNDTLSGNNASAGAGGTGGAGGKESSGTNPGVGGHGGNGGNGAGGGLYISSGITTLANTLIAQNTIAEGVGGQPGWFLVFGVGANGTSGGPDVSGTVASSAHDLIGDGTGFSATSSTSDLIGTSSNPINPLLGSLANYGGPTQTMALLPNSPAIDAGNSTLLPVDPNNALLLIADPGFETPSLGSGSYRYRPTGSPWAFIDPLGTNNAGLASNGSGFNNPPAPQGSQVAFLQASGSMSQVVYLPAGTYVLNFMAAQRQEPNQPPQQQTFQVEVDGTELAAVTPSGSQFALYTSGPFVVVTAGPHIIQFVGLNPLGGDNTAFLDQILIGPPTEQDQRGFPRVVGSNVDIGAFEVQPLSITTTTLPDGTYGTPYSQSIAATEAGASSFTFSLSAGSPLPGLTLAGDGTLSGPPTVAGPFSFTVQAQDNYGFTASQAYTVNVAPATPSVQVTDAGGTYNQLAFPATAAVAGVSGTFGSSLEGVTPTLTYYSGGTQLAGAPILPGTYTAKASFAGSTDYTSASAMTTFTISPDPTSISVSASSATPVYGQSVTLTATVTTPAGDLIPTSADGMVTFYDGTTSLGTANLSGSPATATLTTAALTAGPHTITASYSGDNNFAPASMQTAVPVSGLNFPESVAVDPAGNVYIADTNNNQVVVLPYNRAQFAIDLYYQVNGGQFTPTFFSGPFAVAAAGPGLADVTDGTNALVQVPLGGPPFQIGYGIVTPPGQATDSQGDVFIADPAHNQVLEQKTDGSVTTVGSGLNQPHGVAVDASGNLFIADSGNNRVVEVKAGLPVTVSPANAHPSVTGYSIPYDGNAHTAVASATDINGNPLPASDFVLTATVHTNGGSYTDAWSFHDPSGNYQDASGTASDTISPANAHPSVTGYGIPYDGNAHTSVASATDVNGNPLPASDFQLTATMHTSAGSYTDAWSFHDPSGNYQDSTGTVSDSISPANAHPSVTGYGIPYDGHAHTAVGSATDVNGNPLPASDFVLTATVHTSAGTYTDAWSFHDPSGNYQDASGTVSDRISDPFVPFVTSLSQIVLTRTPSPVEVSAWVQFLHAGHTRTEVAKDFWESGEHRGIQVDGIYRTYLHRTESSAERMGWVAAMVNGMSQVQVIQLFLSSGEYQSAHPSDASFIDSLYVNLLGRVETRQEQTNWVGYLETHTRDQLEGFFLHTSEFDKRIVDSYYTSLLRRSADPAGESNAVNFLLAGGTLDAIAESLLASDEFFANASSGLL